MKEEANNKSSLPAALHLLSASQFQPYIGQEFRIEFSDGVCVVAQLEEVVALPGYTPLERKPFSIILQTELKTTYYLQAIYTVAHPSFGSMSIFLVPVGIKGKGMQYEAVFS